MVSIREWFLKRVIINTDQAYIFSCLFLQCIVNSAVWVIIFRQTKTAGAKFELVALDELIMWKVMFV